MLLRILIVAALVWLVLRLLRGSRRARVADSAQGPAGRPLTTVVRCACCGLHVPQDEALERDGVYYCCPEHRDGKG